MQKTRKEKKKQARKIPKLLTALALTLCLFVSCQKGPDEGLGIPYADLKACARVPWDMVIFDGCLYVGAGDYGRNLSPGRVLRCSLSEEKWEECGKIHDEQINRFVFLGETLVIPGTDPTGSWEWGGYYVLGEDGFREIDTIPHGVHNFDMALYQGRLFAALGVDTDSFPVAVSDDGGQSFSTLSLLRDGKEVSVFREDDYNRIYDFFIHGENLYLLYYDDLYLYREGGKSAKVGYFDFVSSWEGKYQLAKETYVPILAKASFAGRYFFTTETLYVCDEVNGLLGDPQPLSPNGFDRIYDLYVEDGLLYLLAVEELGDEYQMTVLAAEEDGGFSTLFSFTDPLPAMSFAKEGESFYFGLGKINGDDKRNGTILKIDRTA